MNRHLIFGLVAAGGLTIGLLAGAGFASHNLTLSPVAGVTATGPDAAGGGATPKAKPSESPEPADTPDPSETPEAGGGKPPGTAAPATHPCNHGFYVSQAAHAHQGGPFVSSVARTDLGRNGDCTAPLPKP